MSNKIIIPLLVFIILLSSCVSSKKISNYYFQNQQILDAIQSRYKEQYNKRAFSIEFTDKTFKHVSIEMFTDTIKYIYEFDVSENRMNDTLLKYKLPVTEIKDLIAKMQQVKCTWINNLDYYIAEKKERMVFLSFRPKLLNVPFANKKYYILTYFTQPQYYNSEGVLLDRRHRRKLRKINNDIFKRVTDKVAYTISDRYR